MQVYATIRDLGSIAAEYVEDIDQYHVWMCDKSSALNNISIFFKKSNTPGTHLFTTEGGTHGLTILDDGQQIVVYSEDRAKVLELAHAITTVEDQS